MWLLKALKAVNHEKALFEILKNTQMEWGSVQLNLKDEEALGLLKKL